MKFDWKSGLGLALTAGLLWWTLRGMSVTDVWAVVRASNWLLFALCTIVATCIFPLRARRWRTILEPVAGAIPFGPLWRSTAIGVMMNNVFPMRAGEFGRAFALNRSVPRVPMSTALGSLAVDRMFDAICIFALMFGGMLAPGFPTGATVGGRTVSEMAVSGIVMIAVLLGGCYAVALQPDRVMGTVRAIAHRVIPKFEKKILQIVEHGIGGFAVLRDSRRFGAALVWAMAHWVVNALGMYIGFLAIGIDAPFSAALFLQGILAIGVAAPSSPGFFGVFEYISVVGLAVYGVPKELAFSWAITYHLLTFVPISAFGAVYFARLGLSAKSMASAKDAAPA